MMISQDEVEAAVLDHLFDRANRTAGKTKSADVANDLQLPEPRVAMALRSLEKRQLLRAAHNYLHGSSYEISENGYRQIEAARHVGDIETVIESEPHAAESNDPMLAPASDRIVSLDHNSESVREAIEAADSLAAQLRKSNDIGGLTAEAAEVAVVEVEQIASDLKQRAVRMPAFGERAKSTLAWIGKEAAGAVIGTMALGLLALLAALLGFPL